jgi:hypothetical protein
MPWPVLDRVISQKVTVGRTHRDVAKGPGDRYLDARGSVLGEGCSSARPLSQSSRALAICPQPLPYRISNMPEPMLIAQSETSLYLLPAMSNRHGLIAGATGTGKTVTLQVIAESFSRIGVPVFAADVKGDLSGISQPGVENPKIADRVKKLKLTDFSFCWMSGHFLGCLRRTGPSGSSDGFGNGPLALPPAAESE